jgi:hypothetical protein
MACEKCGEIAYEYIEASNDYGLDRSEFLWFGTARLKLKMDRSLARREAALQTLASHKSAHHQSSMR